jgi:WD40 repeat protein
MDVATLDISNLVPLFKQNQSPIVHLAFSPNGRYLAAACLDGRATLWDLKIYESDPTYQPLLLEDHEGWATSICFSPDERFLLVGTKNGEVAFWNLDPSVFAEHLCNQLRARYLSPRYDEMESTDWRRFFGNDIKQQKVCGGN